MSSVVNIKNEAKLLKANTLMIELYVFIQNRKNKNLDFNLEKTQNRFLDPIYEKIPADQFTQRYGFKDFILCVGRIEPRKNQLNIIRALRGIKSDIVFIGDYKPLFF